MVKWSPSGLYTSVFLCFMLLWGKPLQKIAARLSKKKKKKREGRGLNQAPLRSYAPAVQALQRQHEDISDACLQTQYTQLKWRVHEHPSVARSNRRHNAGRVIELSHK